MIASNDSLSKRKISEFAQVSSGYSSNDCPETSLQSLVSSNANEQNDSNHLQIFHTPAAPCKVYLSTSILSFACTSSYHSISTRCACSFCIGTKCFQKACFNADGLLIIQICRTCGIRSTPSCRASVSLAQMACSTLFTVEYSASAPCVSIKESFSESSVTLEKSHIV